MSMCVICLQPLLDCPVSELWAAPCAHIFHRYCVESFAKARQFTVPALSCPVCKISFKHVVDVKLSPAEIVLSSEEVVTAIATQRYTSSPAAALPDTAPVVDPLEPSNDLFMDSSHPVSAPSEPVARRSRKRPPPVRTLPPLARRPLVMAARLSPVTTASLATTQTSCSAV